MKSQVEEPLNKLEEPIADYGIEYTYADYLKFDFEEMVELIKGKIFKMSPAPSTNHQRILGRMSFQFNNSLERKKCEVFIAPTDVILPIANKKRETATTVVQPDLFVICNEHIVEYRGIFGVPNLIIEILSPHTKKKDLQNKYEVYEEAGVNEYWIVMPEQKLVEVFVLENQKYKRIQTYVHTDMLECVTIPELVIDLNLIFEGLKD
jgi:Uma2 family endonuclease